MSKRKSVLTVVAVLVLSLFSTKGVLVAEEKANGSLNAFKRASAYMGFIVQEGLVDFPDLVDMCCNCQVPSCFANNPSSPYGIFVLPPSPNQASTVPNPYSEWFTEDQT